MAKMYNIFFRTVFPKSLDACRHHSSSSTVKTALFDFHVQHNGKMVDFGGYLLPVLYTGESITASHLHTRKHCSVFDVSHMLQTKIYGANRFELMERLTTADVKGLPVNKATLTVFTDPATGGILDDLIITNTSEGYLYVVSNAGRRDHDSSLMMKEQEAMIAEKKDVNIELLETSDQSLLAVQGPEASRALQSLCNASLDKLSFMNSTTATVGGIPNCRVNRCGYTGEDGFEVSIPSTSAASLADQLLRVNTADVKLAGLGARDSLRKCGHTGEDGFEVSIPSTSAASLADQLLRVDTADVKLAGLGARDSLRLEAGLCLYGSDVDEKTTPVEASLSWLLAKRRIASKDFPGAEIICKQIKDGVSMRRIGLKFEGGTRYTLICQATGANGGRKLGWRIPTSRGINTYEKVEEEAREQMSYNLLAVLNNTGPPARHGCIIIGPDGEKAGIVTSGGPSPSLGHPIAMGYLTKSLCKVNTKVQVSIRGKNNTATVVKMPFVPTTYYTSK